MENLKIKKEVYDKIVAQAKDSSNREICGLGFAMNGEQIVDDLHTAMNISTSDFIEYVFSPQDFGLFLQHYNKKGKDKEMLMIWHTHPKWSAFPSGKDIMNAYPNIYYLIYSNLDDEARVFLLQDVEKRVMKEIPIEIV